MELLVSVTVILVVLAVAGAAYLKVMRSFKVQASLPEGRMSHLTGLELLRYDVEMAGYGLPFDVNGTSFAEAASSGSATPDPNAFNDSPNAPRAMAFSNNGNTSAHNSDVLVLKSAVANVSGTSRKWSVLYHDGANWKVKDWNSSELDFSTGERFIVLDTDKQLQKKGGAWFFTFAGSYHTSVGGADPVPTPSDTHHIFLLYGIDPDTDLRMPFNRVDYYLDTPASGLPDRCDPNSYILYRATINQGNGVRNPQPMIDCVRDFQVAFGLDTDGDAIVDAWSKDLNLGDTNGNGTADEIRSQLKEVRIFLLVQDGVRDDNYDFNGTLTLGDTNTTALSTFTPAGDARHYRWKVFKLAVKPMNLG
nr:PilW family protein [Desulfacinum hydrothermale]